MTARRPRRTWRKGGDSIMASFTCDLKIITCVECGVKFGIDADYDAILHDHQGGVRDGDLSEDGAEEEQGGWFSCPNGHRNQYVKTPTRFRQEKLVELTHALEQAEGKATSLTSQVKRLEKQRDRYKAEVKRLKERVAGTDDAKVTGQRASTGTGKR